MSLCVRIGKIGLSLGTARGLKILVSAAVFVDNVRCARIELISPSTKSCNNLCRQFVWICCGPISGYTARMAAFSRINILDKVLPAGGYFKRFRSCEIETRNTRYTAGQLAVYSLARHESASARRGRR